MVKGGFRSLVLASTLRRTPREVPYCAIAAWSLNFFVEVHFHFALDPTNLVLDSAWIQGLGNLLKQP